MDELISVIVPVYNGEKYLPICMKHLLEQTYRDLEILLVDDGSKDSSGAQCDAYASQDSRVRVIHQENRGVSGARNTGLDHATGKYVAFVDADDYVEPDFLERLHKNLVTHGVDIASCDYREVISGEMTKTFIPFVAETRLIEKKETFFEDMILAREAYWSTITAKLFLRELVGETRFNAPFRYGEDHVFLFDLFSKAPKVHQDTYQGYYYVRNESSATLTRNASNVYRCENEMKMQEYKLRNLPEDVQHLKGGFWEMYAHSIHNLARALALTGTKQERKTYRNVLLPRIQECFREAGSLSGQTKVFLSLYRYLPRLYQLLICAKVKARSRMA